MRRSIITTIVFVVGMTVYLLLLGHVVENQQAMQREECAQAAQIYADELEKDFNTSSPVTETLAYMIADTGTVPQHFADVAKEMMATRPYVASIQLAPQGRVTDDYQAIALRQPIYLADAAGNRTFWGFAIAVLKVPDVFESTLTDLQETRHAYRISKTAPGRDDYHIVLASDNLPEQMEKKVFSYGGCQWKLEVAPADGWRIPLPLAVTLAVGLLLVFVLTFLTHVLVTLQNRRQYLRQLADTDVLTGLYNRQGFDTAVDAYLDRYPKAKAVGIMIDIDDFKRINDLYSHDAGDAALRSMACSLSETFQHPAILGRNGGDEFCIFLPDCTAAEVDPILRKFSARLQSFSYEGHSHTYTISMGYAAYPNQGSSHAELFRCADAALYAVKLRGKNGVLPYTMHISKEDRSQLAFGLKDIILHFPGAILIYKATGKEEILFANLELIQLFDCTTLEEFQQHTGGTFRGIVHPDEYDAVEQSIWEQVKKPGSESNDAVRYRIRTKTGNIKNILDKGRLVDTDVYGQIFYVLLIDESNW